MEKIIRVGSTNEAKLAAVKKVFEGYNVIGEDVESGVAKQPKSEEETINGAYNRANNIEREDSLRLGLEAGVCKIGTTTYLVNFGSLIDEQNNVYTAGGTYLPLPQDISDAIYKNNMELKDLVKNDTVNGAVAIFTCNKVLREDIFTHICKLLYGQYIYKKEHENE